MTEVGGSWWVVVAMVVVVAFVLLSVSQDNEGSPFMLVVGVGGFGQCCKYRNGQWTMWTVLLKTTAGADHIICWGGGLQNCF